MTERQPNVTMADLRIAAELRLDEGLASGQAVREEHEGRPVREYFTGEPRNPDIVRFITASSREVSVEGELLSPDRPQERREVSVYFTVPGKDPTVTEVVITDKVRSKEGDVPPEQHGRIAAELIRLVGLDDPSASRG